MNEILIRPDLSDSTEEKSDEDVVVECKEEDESSSGADCMYTAASLDSGLNMVMMSFESSTSTVLWPEILVIIKFSSSKRLVLFFPSFLYFVF